jgi:hypothetical protein
MSDITVRRSTFQSENRSWLRGPDGTLPGDNPSIVLDVSAFTAGTHYPSGFVPSGTVLGKITTSGLYAPYDPAATNGSETAVEILFSSVTIGSGATRVGGAGLHKGEVIPSKLPFQTGKGALDADARTDLKLVNFSEGA